MNYLQSPSEEHLNPLATQDLSGVENVTAYPLEQVVLHAFQLNAPFRKVYLLCDVQGRSVAETAAILDISPAAVKMRLRRARITMKARLNNLRSTV